ncbi:MAG: hypothetical protein IPM77_04220 [Crocinitomicaceae bacterium]|nr:hypothetical protein [Crocinitomicaceae bacterium]
MIKYYTYCTGILFLFFLFGVSSCSTEKDAAINRGYHNMTARFNGYYNAGVVTETALTGYRGTFVDEYYQIIPLEVYPTEKDAQALSPEMDRAIEKCEREILRHSMPSQTTKKKDEELCRWIDDNWLVIAKAHYYKREYMLAEQNLTTFRKHILDRNQFMKRRSGWLKLKLHWGIFQKQKEF